MRRDGQGPSLTCCKKCLRPSNWEGGGSPCLRKLSPSDPGSSSGNGRSGLWSGWKVPAGKETATCVLSGKGVSYKGTPNAQRKLDTAGASQLGEGQGQSLQPLERGPAGF